MKKIFLRVICLAAAGAIVLTAGCGDSWIKGGDSDGVDEFLSWFREGAGGSGECEGYTLTIRASPAAGGTVLPSGTHHCYKPGTDVRVTATANKDVGYFFAGWSGASTWDTTLTVTMNSDMILTANFQQYGILTDSRDGQTKKYRTIIMPDGKRWMAENLNFAGQISGNSWCYGEGGQVCDYYGYPYNYVGCRTLSATEVQANCAMYGRLYDWDGAMSACQGLGNGWHLPTEQEWIALVNAVFNAVGVNWYISLKSTSGWEYFSSIFGQVNGNGTDDFGFSVLPGGFRDIDGRFCNAGSEGVWWDATDWYDAYDGWASNWPLWDTDRMGVGYHKSGGLSVRCVAGD